VTAPSFYFLLPGSPETPTGGFVYDRHMLRALRAEGRLTGGIVLPGGYPHPSEAAGAAGERAIEGLPDGASAIIDGLAFSPLLEAFAVATSRLSIYPLVHHPLCDETGLSATIRGRLRERERQALGLARGVVVTSEHTALRLADFGVPAGRVRVVRPGVDGPPRGSESAGYYTSKRASPVELLCVASLSPRKGQDVLLRALARLRCFRWRLLLVGPARDAAFAGRLRRLAQDLGIEGRIVFAGVVKASSLPRLYRLADLFVLPSHHEGYGIAVAEAAAYGLPVVASDAGAILEAIVGARHRLVPPGDAAALADAVRGFLVARREIGGDWRAPADTRPRSWTAAGREFLAALDALHSS
jgi:glycosyltransferase involved in cell wall biosynthesis